MSFRKTGNEKWFASPNARFLTSLVADTMQLPHHGSAIVPRGKIEGYLLTLEHPIGGGKAKFFTHFGFHREQWEELAAAVLHHARENPITNTLIDADGITYVIEGGLMTPSGRKSRVRTVWLIETGGLAPRFITAYPLEA
jgi:hypothetical protein